MAMQEAQHSGDHMSEPIRHSHIHATGTDPIGRHVTVTKIVGGFAVRWLDNDEDVTDTYPTFREALERYEDLIRALGPGSDGLDEDGDPVWDETDVQFRKDCPPAGWYPQPDGQQRWWDGDQWTQILAPGVPPVPPTVAKRDRRGPVLLLIVGLAAVGLFIWNTSGGVSGGGLHTVTYTVTGSGPGASARITTYMTDAGSISQDTDVRLPYAQSFQMTSGSPLVMNAQNSGDSGDITCTISVDGVDVQSNTSTGAYAVCQASTRL